MCNFDYAMTGKRLQSNNNNTAGGCPSSSSTAVPPMAEQTHETVDAAESERLGNGDQLLANDNSVTTVPSGPSGTDALSGSDGGPAAANGGGTGAAQPTPSSDSKQLTVSSTLTGGTAGDPLSPSLMNNQDDGNVGDITGIKNKRHRRRTPRSRGLGGDADDGPSAATTAVPKDNERGGVTEIRNRRSRIKRARRPSAAVDDHDDDDRGEDIIVLKPCKSARRKSKKTGCKRKRSSCRTKSRCKRKRRPSCGKPRRCRGIAEDDEWSNISVIEVEERDPEPPSNAVTSVKRSKRSKRSTVHGGGRQKPLYVDDDDLTEAESSVSVKFASTGRKTSTRKRCGGGGGRVNQMPSAGSSATIKAGRGLPAEGRRHGSSKPRAARMYNIYDTDDDEDDID